MHSPIYTNSTISHNLYEFTNREKDLIRQAFNSTNFTYFYKLPNQISPTQVSKSLKTTTLDKLSKRYNSVPKQKNNFSWLPDDYEAVRIQKNADSADSKQKQSKISSKMFKLPGIHKKLKSEDLAGHKIGFNEDSFNSVDEQVTRIKWIEKTKDWSSDFKSAGKNLYNVTRNRIREIIKKLKNKIETDWKRVDFTVMLGSQEAIEVMFLVESVENRTALHHYMNVLQAADKDLQEFGLKKLMNRWGKETNGKVFYCLIPPWVHTNPANIFSSLFPHSSIISFSKTRKNIPGSERQSILSLTTPFIED